MFLSLSTLSDIILTTAHKAKGLEFDTVKLADDFILEMFFQIGKFQMPSQDKAPPALDKAALSPQVIIAIINYWKPLRSVSHDIVEEEQLSSHTMQFHS